MYEDYEYDFGGFTFVKNVRIRVLVCSVEKYLLIDFVDCPYICSENVKYFNIVEPDLITCGDRTQYIPTCLTFKNIVENIDGIKIHRRLIVIDQINKFCTFCENIKENKYFTNQTNNMLLNVSDYCDMLTMCNECDVLNKGLFESSLCIKANEIFTSEISTFRDVAKMKYHIIKIITSAKHKKLLEIYFIIKCKVCKNLTQNKIKKNFIQNIYNNIIQKRLIKNLTQYIFDFVEKDILYKSFEE